MLVDQLVSIGVNRN